jgi:hypothetical protein
LFDILRFAPRSGSGYRLRLPTGMLCMPILVPMVDLLGMLCMPTWIRIVDHPQDGVTHSVTYALVLRTESIGTMQTLYPRQVSMAKERQIV